jgi:5-methyltetrahydrofolate--homocysteine methyltransferase
MLDAIYQGIIAGDFTGVAAGVQLALEAGHTPADILDQGLLAAMAEIGRRFEHSECFVPEMLVAARAMQQGLAVLKPHLVRGTVAPAGVVVLGTVRGDLHDLGKNLVGLMLEGTGFEIIDLGVDVPPEEFVAAARRYQPAFIGLSAMLTTTMPIMLATIEALKEAGLRDRVNVMVGGAPVSQQFCDQIGADLYAPDAAAAASRARAMLNNA